MMTNIDVKFRNPYNNCILRKIIYHQYLPILIGIFDQMGAQTDRLRYWNLLLPTATPLSNVATAPTVYGIETFVDATYAPQALELQQPLPFTVLKLSYMLSSYHV